MSASFSSTANPTDLDFAAVVRTRREMDQEKNRLDMKIARDKTQANHTRQQMVAFMKTHNLSQVVLPMSVSSDEGEPAQSVLYVTCCQKLKRAGLSVDDMDRFFQTVCPTWRELETIAKEMQAEVMEKSQTKTSSRKKVKADPPLPSPSEAYVEWLDRTIEDLFAPVASPPALELRQKPCKALGSPVPLDETSPLFSMTLTYQTHVEQIKKSTITYKETVEKLKARQEEAAARVRDYILRHRKSVTVVAPRADEVDVVGKVDVSVVGHSALPECDDYVEDEEIEETHHIDDACDVTRDVGSDKEAVSCSEPCMVTSQAPVLTQPSTLSPLTPMSSQPSPLSLVSPPISSQPPTLPPSMFPLTVTDVLSRHMPPPAPPQTVTDALNPLPPPVVYSTGMVEQRVTHPEAKNETSYIRVVDPKPSRVTVLARTIAVKTTVAAIRQAWSDVSWQDQDRLTTLHHQTRQRALQLFENELCVRNAPPPPAFKLGVFKKPYENLQGKAKTTKRAKKQ